MLKKPVAAAAPMELLKQNMAAVASSSMSFFGIRDEDQIQMKQLQQQQQQQQQHFSIPTSSTTPPTTAPQKKRRNFPGTPSKIVSKGYKLVGCGSAVTSLQVSNDDLAKVVDTSNEWISVRIGIRNQRVLTVVVLGMAEGLL